MPSYTLELELLGTYLVDMPGFEIWTDGTQEGGTYSISSSGTSISIVVNYGGALPTSLEFRFNDASGEAGRTIEIQSVKINNKYVNTSNYLSSDSLTNGGNATVDVNNSAFIFDATEPTGADFLPATQTFTAGNDTFRDFNGVTDQTFDMLAGRDVAFLGSGNDSVNGGAGDDYIRGRGGNDLLYGAGDNDRLFGDDGDDTLYGGTGNDAIYGGNDNDEIHGGDGDDRLHGQNGDDVITGGLGNDVITGGAGTNFMFGDAGNDQIMGGHGVDTIDGGDDDDVAYGGGGDDILEGGNGNDTLVGDAGNDRLDGNDGDDILNGRADNDELNGGAGNDILAGEDGIDILNGDAGADILVGGDGTDTLNGGTGNDILHGSGLTVTEIITLLQANPNVVYSAGSNSFYQYVNSTANYATALAAATGATLGGLNGHLVSITSAAENDFVRGLIGGTTWMGGTDNIVDGEWRWTGGAEDGAQFSDIAGNPTNNFYENWDAGQPQNNTEHNSVLYTNGTWHDWPDTSSHRYVIEWDAGLMSDDLAIDTLDGGSGDDFLYGYGGDDILDGGADNDVLFGGLGDDTIDGGTGNDAAYGGAGADLLTGDTGDDLLDGGDDDDVIVAGAGIAPTIDATTILSYDASQDSGGAPTYFTGGMTLDGNLWKRVALNYTVTANTILEFDFRSTFEPEINGIGFDTDNAISSNRIFQVYGTQNWGINAFQNYDGSGEWTHYRIDVGSYFTGNFTHLVFANDDDANPLGNGSWANITIYESSVATDDDTVEGGNGNDQLFGNEGSDIINGGAGNDILNGNDGDDTLNGGADNDTLSGGAGNDTLDGGAGIDRLTGGSGNDGLTGGSGDDFLYGNDGADTLNGGADTNVMYGGDGLDNITGGTGNDYIAGDTYTYDHASLLKVFRLEEGAGTSIYDSLGGAQTGTLTGAVSWINNIGTDKGNALYFDGGAGYDPARAAIDTFTIGGALTFSAWARFDNLNVGGEGWQRIFDFGNGEANDNILFGQVANGTTITFEVYDGGASSGITVANAIVEGEWAHWAATVDASGNMAIYKNGILIGSGTGSVPNTLARTENYLGDSNWAIDATLTGAISDFSIHTTDLSAHEISELYAASNLGFSGVGNVIGDTGNDIIDAGAGDDHVLGEGGNDTISGGAGNDLLFGHAGNDTIYGVSAADSATSSVTDGTLNSFNATFNAGTDGYTLNDDALGNGTGAYTDGFQTGATGGLNNGALQVTVGGVDNNTITDMAGIFFDTFNKASATSNIYLQLSYRHVHTAGFENNEFSYALYDLNGSTTILSTLVGDGNGGPDMDTGWTTVTIDFGVLAAGNHTLSLGAYLNQKTIADEEAFVWFDDVTWVEQEISANTGITNRLYGGDGLDTLYGSTETDIFVFDSATAFNDIDQIEYFNANEDDQLDLSDILTGFDPLSDNISEFLTFTNSGGNSLIQVDTDGAAGGYNYVTIGQLNGINDVDEVALFHGGNLIV
jgi:Ca2+-binding RTX toxin-like protein